MGAYGLSKLVKDGGLINSYAEGGEVKTYAGDKGSVTSDYFERSALDDIRANDGALQKARQAALARRDLETVNYIDKLLAENVSMRSGLGGAFNSLSPEVQDNIVAAAGGGIVAFAKGGDKGEEVVYQDPLGAPDYEVDTQALSRTFSPKQNVREGETYTPGLRGMLFGYDVLPREEKAAPKVPAYSDSDAAERADRMTGTTASSASTGAGVKEALKVMADAHGLSVNSLMGAYEQMRDRLSAENKPILDRLDKLGEKLSGRADKIRSEMLPKMLAEFGFQWAAGAAKPGQARRPGLAGALESAAAASPALAASAAESQKAIDKAEDAYTLLQMENAKYRLAMQKGDNATAMQHATNMRQLEVSMRQLQLQAQQIAQAGAYQQGMLGIHGEELGIKKELAKSRGISAAASALQGQARVADVARKAGLDFDNSRDARTLMKQLTEQYGPDKARYMYGQQRRAYISDNTQGIRDQVSQDAQVRNVYDLLSE
jgi:plasmid stability protein